MKEDLSNLGSHRPRARLASDEHVSTLILQPFADSLQDRAFARAFWTLERDEHHWMLQQVANVVR